MHKERIILWGTGEIASQVFKECLTINQYDILAFIDNDDRKWGIDLFGIKICSPQFLMENKDLIEKIVILTNSYGEIKQQIIELSSDLEILIENKYYFYKRSILKRYSNSCNLEIKRIIRYLQTHSLGVFNYDFTEKYKFLNPEILLDESNGLYYVVHSGKRMYFSRDYQNEEDVKKYYISICLEQDICSPHRYLADGFFVNEDDTIIDVGVAEGNFTLSVIDCVKKAYLIEADPKWIEALKYTFEPYKEKVVIIEKYASSYSEGDFARIDSLVDENVDFIKMDIEGQEHEALIGANELLEKTRDIKVAACCYHSDFDQILIETELAKHNFECTTTNGYMWYPYTNRQAYVSTKLNRGIVRGIKR